jgi:hypothetical protein
MWTFASLTDPSIFIAAPGDVKYLRDATMRKIEAVHASAADDHAVGVYNWIVDKSENGFVDWVPAQGQIPRPDDPLCRMVICLFGEKIGSPLPEDFPLDALDGLDLGRAGMGPFLFRGAPTTPLPTGGFRLTGSVFECLAALAAHRRRDAATRPPVLILFVGDESLNTEAETSGSGTRYGYQNALSRPFNAPGLRALSALHAGMSWSAAGL